MIVSTLSYCLNAQLQQIKTFEDRVNAHKLMLLNLNGKSSIDEMTVKNKKYIFTKNENNMKVHTKNEIYQITW